MNLDTKSIWIGKKVKIEILKDNTHLNFNALILEYDNKIITFKDRDGLIFSFNVDLVQQIKEVLQ